MSRFLRSFVVISGVLALAAAAGADERQQHHSSGLYKQQNRNDFGGWSGISRFVSDFKHHHDHQHQPTKQPIPIDPGRGDGRVPVNPTPVTPPARDGFVWVKDHWERERAPKAVNPYPADVIVRDHRTPSPSGGVIIRDHRTPTVGASGGTIIRDHRTTTDWAPGGTTVRDHRTPDSSNASGGTVIVTNPVPRNSGPVIRDHRTGPVVRDHRTGQ